MNENRKTVTDWEHLPSPFPSDEEIQRLLDSPKLEEQIEGLAWLQCEAHMYDQGAEGCAMNEEHFSRMAEESRRLHDRFYHALAVRGLSLEAFEKLRPVKNPRPVKNEAEEIPF